jgi:two-component sensor histidine kinase
MSLIHEGLCFSETLAEIEFSKYAEQLGRRLIQSYAPRPDAIQLHIDANAVLRLDEATPCGLILNELLSNSLKHAFPDARQGDIWITVRDQSGDVTMEVRDNGIGVPAGLSVENSESLGLLIVTDLTAQLHGSFSWCNDGGAVFLVRFRRREQQTDFKKELVEITEVDAQ